MSRAEDSSSSTSSMNHQNEDLEKSSRVDETGRQIVKFDEPGKTPGDPSNPRAWLKSYKWLCLMVLNNCSLCVTMTSSVISLSYGGIKEDFGIGQEVATLGLSLFVLGLSLGPLLFGPLSEFYGRRPIYLWTYAAFLLLGFPVAFSNNAAVFFIFRFLTGISGSAFLSVAGGTVSDCFNNREIVIPMVIYSSFPFFGPVLGPILGGFINQHASWRWSFYMVLIWSAANIFLIYFFSPETFAPIILTNKAKALRKRGNENAISEHEIKMAGKSVSQTIIISSKRVFLMLIFEPILLLLCIWSALLLSILYCFFGAFPIVFRQKNFNLQSQGLSFLGLAVGMILALLSSTFWKNRYLRRMDEAEAKGEEVPPEARLGQAKVGAFLSVIGLFCFAFTSYQHVHWSAAIISSIPFGASIILIFASVFTFTSDVYGPAGVAASALCANSFVRCLSSAAFPLFTRQMYHALTPVGASALLAGLNVLMIPLPFVFYKYGAAIRAKSRFAT